MIKSVSFGKTPDGRETKLYHLENGRYSADITDFGATLVRFCGPDRNGRMTDVLLGFDNVVPYTGSIGYMGAVIGRFGNRIEKGKFTLNGKEYTLAVNNGPNHLHGGNVGFSHKIFAVRNVDDHTIEFGYLSPDGEEGYPGNLDVQVTYSLSQDGTLTIDYYAISDADTVINLTNHAYFNLNGEGNGNILGHTLRLNASEYLPTSDSLIPLGESEPVAGTPMDFVSEKVIGAEIKADFPALVYGKGYDNCWVIDGYEPGQIQEAAELYAPESGRVLNVYTTQPGVQVYTGNWLAGCPVAKCGRSYNDYDGVAIECQNFPDAPNKPEYPSAVLRPGEVYQQAIIFAFGVRI